MRFLFFMLPLLLISAVHVSAQSIDTAWVRTYNGPENLADSATALAVDDSGNVYVTGSSYGSGTSTDYSTIKYYPDGDTAWVRRYNGTGDSSEVATALAVDDSGNIYITGLSYGSGTSADYLTIKYYPNGDSAWTRRYNGTTSLKDMANAIAVDDSGNVYVTGYSTGSGYYAEYATIKYDSSGNELWVKSYKGPGITNWAKAIAVDSSSNVYVTGYSHGGGTGYDYVTIKYYPNGDTGWVRRYNGPGNGNDKAYDIAVDGSGNVYVTGWGVGLETDRDCATVKYDPDGKKLWACGYNGMLDSGWDETYTITLDDSGNIYVTGYSQGNDTGYDYVTIKYYSMGDTAWVRKYNGPANLRDVAKSIAVDSSGNVYVTGASDCATGSDFVTIKYDTSGNQLWESRYNGKGDKEDEACAIVVDRSGNAFVTGKSSGIDTNYDYVTIKYVRTETFVEGVGDGKSIYSFNLSQNYPNPFNHKTKIEYYLHDPAWINMTLYNIMGQKVKVLVEEFQSAGSKSLTWYGKDNTGKTVASGIYFYKLQVTGYVQSKKMLFLK